MKKALFTIFTIVFFSNIYAQKNYASGFIINLQGDTIRGAINDLQWSKNPRKIQFRDSKGSVNKYGAKEIKAFYLDSGQLYESHLIEYDIAQKEIEYLKEGGNEKIVHEWIFLRTVLKASISLFEFRDSVGKTHVFLQESGKPIYELLIEKSIKFIKDNGGRTYRLEGYGKEQLQIRKKYINQLKKALVKADCDDLFAKISHASFGTKTFKNILLDYFQCPSINEKPYFISPKPDFLRFRPNFSIGMSRTVLKTGGNFPRYLNQFSPDPSQDFMAGVGLELEFQKRRKQLSLLFDFLYKSQTFYQPLDWEILSVREVGHRTLEMDYIRINFLFKHTLPIKKLKPYYKIGLGYGFVFSKTNSADFDRIDFNGNTIERTLPIIPNFKENEQSRIIGLGIQFLKHFEIECLYDLGNGFAYSSEFFTKTRSVMVLARYRL